MGKWSTMELEIRIGENKMKVGDLVYRRDHDANEWRPIYMIIGIDSSLCDKMKDYGHDWKVWTQYILRRVPFQADDSEIPFFFNGLEAISETR